MDKEHNTRINLETKPKRMKQYGNTFPTLINKEKLNMARPIKQMNNKEMIKRQMKTKTQIPKDNIPRGGAEAVLTSSSPVIFLQQINLIHGESHLTPSLNADLSSFSSSKHTKLHSLHATHHCIHSNNFWAKKKQTKQT